MKRIITLFSILIGATSFGQLYQTDFSDWTGGDPDGWMGVRTNIPSSQVVEQGLATYGSSQVSLVNATTSHLRFTTQGITVVAGETYEIKMWVAASAGEIRTNYYDNTNSAYGTYNSYIDLSSTSGGSLVEVSQTVTMPATCTEAEFIISVVNTDAATSGLGIGILIDSLAIEVGTPPVATGKTIYEIQYTTDPSGDSPEEGNIVTTSGIVTGVMTVGSSTGTFFIQDGDGAWNGLYIFEDGTAVSLGDSVSVTGLVTEYFTLTELTSVTDITIHSSGHPQPNAVDIATGGATGLAQEQYESVLVNFNGNAECTNDDAGFGQFEVNDGSGATLVDDDIFSYTATLGSVYNITGVSHYSFSEYKVLPRQITDITVVGTAGIDENFNEFTVHPNPAIDVLYINGNSSNTVTIYSLDGALVYSGVNDITIDVSAFDAGIYVMEISSANGTQVERLVIR
ncbi:MAG: T9SS type A sorting domain-containing protein [Crocinitomicaceae bacterium]|nr:T9SS type A sorting domain-containing protein [Crocinitomicaceae bacterium]